MEIEHIDLVEGQDVYGGLKVTAYYALLSDILTFPAFDVAGTAIDGSELTITGDIVFNTGKCFKRLESTEEQTGFEASKLGGIGNTATETLFRFGHEGVPALVAHWFKHVHNRKLVVVFEDESNTYLIGLPGYPARVSEYSEAGGNARGDDKMISGTIRMAGPQKAYYNGLINLVPAL